VTEKKPLRLAHSTVALLGAVVSMTMLLAVDARAARYDVHACRVPDGKAVSANGWRLTAPTLGGGAQASIDCPGKGMSSRPMQASYEDGTLLGFEFSAPPGTTIVGWKRVSDGYMKTLTPAPPPYWWEVGGFGDRANGAGRAPVMLECGNCGTFQADWDVPRIARPLSRLFFAMRCDAIATPCQGNGSYFTLRSIAVHLEDARPPQIVGASGDLLDATASKPGLHYVSLDLRDVGSGLDKARIEADGHLLSEQSVDENGGACREPFIQSVPCKLAAKVDLPVDTTRLTPGHHTLTVRVFDATGVNSAVYGPISVDVEDPTKLRCPPEADGVLTRRVRRALVRFGGTTWLTGRAIGAIGKRGRRVRLLGSQSVGTSLRKGGRFRLRVRPARTGRLTPVLVDGSGAALICGKPIHVGVRAGARLVTTPKHLNNGEAIRLTGKLRGGPLPASGKTVVIQARARGRAVWSTVTLLRSNDRGRFVFRYLFRRTFKQTTYEFRALVPRQRGYPYARGWSHPKRVTVRP
jgi:hypothetical protein